MTLALVTTTVSSRADAERLARALVDAKLAACVQISRVTSIYRWEGITQEEEFRLDCKTPGSLAERLTAKIAALHPYDVPEILCFEGKPSKSYAKWAASVTSSGEGESSGN
ncbi:MAG: divalent-cation tolerance protein CutA [Pseudomonadota bacterium]